MLNSGASSARRGHFRRTHSEQATAPQGASLRQRIAVRVGTSYVKLTLCRSCALLPPFGRREDARSARESAPSTHLEPTTSRPRAIDHAHEYALPGQHHRRKLAVERHDELGRGICAPPAAHRARGRTRTALRVAVGYAVRMLCNCGGERRWIGRREDERSVEQPDKRTRTSSRTIALFFVHKRTHICGCRSEPSQADLECRWVCCTSSQSAPFVTEGDDGERSG